MIKKIFALILAVVTWLAVGKVSNFVITFGGIYILGILDVEASERAMRNLEAAANIGSLLLGVWTAILIYRKVSMIKKPEKSPA